MTSEVISEVIFLDQELSVDFENIFGLWLVPGVGGKPECFTKTEI